MDSNAEAEHPKLNVDSAPLTSLSAPNGAADVKTIIEASLTENFASGTVRSVVIDETPAGYELHVALTWRTDGPFRLVTYRGEKTRVWQSVDRLIKYLKGFENVPPLVIRLLPRELTKGDNASTN